MLICLTLFWYGSIDNGTTLSSEPSFHELMVKAGKMIHIGESLVRRKKEEKKEGEEKEDGKGEQKKEDEQKKEEQKKDEQKKQDGDKKEGEEKAKEEQKDEPVQLAVAVDSKGIIGTDGRKCI